MVARSSRAASREYSGSSAISEAAVWIEIESSSRVDAPSKRPPIVLLATRIASTCGSPAQQRSTARTILFTSTGSRVPLRLRTCICGAASASGKFGSSSVSVDCNVAMGRGPFAADLIVTRAKETERAAQNTILPSPGLPLGGGANNTLGRSSDSQAAYWLQLPSPVPIHGWMEAIPVLVSERSFLFTAAGQFRNSTGIPFSDKPRIFIAWLTTESRPDYIVSS